MRKSLSVSVVFLLVLAVWLPASAQLNCSNGCRSSIIPPFMGLGSSSLTSGASIMLGNSGGAAIAGTTPDTRHQAIPPFGCTIRTMYVNSGVRGTLGVYSSGTTTVQLYINGSAGNNVVTSTTILTATGPTVFSDTSHSDIINAGDVLTVRATAATWSVAPTLADLTVWLGCI